MEESLLQMLLTLLLMKQIFCYSLLILPRPFDYFTIRARLLSSQTLPISFITVTGTDPQIEPYFNL